MSIIQRLGPIPWLAILVVVMGLLVDLHLTRKYGGGDLRDKVVGSRSLIEGRSPYFAPWRPGDPERFADPMVPQGSELTRFTGSPFQALIMSPMGMVPFTWMRLTWLFLQYGLLLISMFMIIRAFGTDHRYAGLIALALLIVIIGSTSWRLHVERGQIYVIYTLIIAGLFVAIKQRQDILLGVLGAVLILFKPTYGLMLLPLIFKITPRMVLAAVATVIVALVPFFFLPDGFNSWNEYSEAMKVWGDHPGRGAIPPTPPMDFQYPQTIEGAGHLADHHSMEAENGSIGALLYKYGLDLPNLIPFLITFLIVGVVGAMSWKKLKKADPADLLILGYCFHTILMMLLPTLRFHYQFVMWVPPLLYVLYRYRNASLAWYTTAAFAGLLVVGALDILPVNVLLAEIILLFLFSIFLYSRIVHNRGYYDPAIPRTHSNSAGITG